MVTIQNLTKTTNKWMKNIFKELGYSANSSTIVARHSFSTHMLYEGATKELIQESLGHQNTKITENYLASFEKSVVKEFATRLAAFRDEPAIRKPVKGILSI